MYVISKDLKKESKELDAAVDEVIRMIESLSSNEKGSYRLPDDILDKLERRDQIILFSN